MNIAFFTHYLGGYGANRSMLNMMSGLKKSGHTPFVICPGEGGVTDLFTEMGITYASITFFWGHANPQRAENEAIERLKQQLQIAGPIINQLLDWNIDLIYTNSSVIDLGYIVSRMMGKPHIWHIREYGALDYSLSPDLGEYSFRQLIRSSDGLVFISKALQDHFMGTSPAGTVIYNGVVTEPEAYSLQQRRARISSREQFTFAFVGVVMPTKGQDYALHALKILVDKGVTARIVFAGSGQTAYIEKLSRDLGVDQYVKILGHVDNPFEIYLNADCALMCSKNEAMGRVTVEAMACSVPVIGNNSGGTPELVKHEYNGLLYDGTVESLAEQMERVIADREKTEELGRNAFAHLLANFTEEIYSGSVDRYITEVVSRYHWEKITVPFEQPESRIAQVYNLLLNTKFGE